MNYAVAPEGMQALKPVNTSSQRPDSGESLAELA